MRRLAGAVWFGSLAMGSMAMASACDGDDTTSATPTAAPTGADGGPGGGPSGPLADIDEDGYLSDVDCDDDESSTHPGAFEICGNGRDDDCHDGDAPCAPCLTGSVPPTGCQCGSTTQYAGHCCEGTHQAGRCSGAGWRSLRADVSIRDSHPRIWLTPEEIAGPARALQSRVAAGGSHEATYAAMVSWCDQHLSDDLSFGSSWTENQAASALYRRSLLNCGLSYLLDRARTQHADRAVEVLRYLATNDCGDWAASAGHTGDTSWLIPMVVATGYDWVYERLSGADKTLIDDYLYAMIVDPAVDCTAHKTEEAWGVNAFVPLALIGEPVCQSTRCEDAYLGFVDCLVTQYVPSHEQVSSDGCPTHYSGLYYLDTVNLYAYMGEGLRTATGIDIFAEFSGPPSIARAFTTLLKPGCRKLNWGDDLAGCSHADSGYLARDIFPVAWHRQDAIGMYAWDAMLDCGHTGELDHWEDVLWHDHQASVAAAPTGYWFRTMGAAVFREGYQFGAASSDAWVSFYAAQSYENHHYHDDWGHLSISRGDDDLLSDTGLYSWDSIEMTDYLRRSVAHNTLIINDQNANGTPSSIGRFASGARIGYVYSDLSGSYDHATRASRSVVVLDGATVLVADRVQTTDSSMPKRVLWHPTAYPSANGTGWPDSMDSATGSVSDDTTQFMFQSGSSQATVHTLYPTDGLTHRLLGGPGHRWVGADYTNMPRDIGDQGACDPMYGTYRVEVETSADTVLTAIQVGASGADEVAVELLESAEMVGALLSGRSAVLFGRDEQPVASTQLNLSAANVAELLLCDLVAGQRYGVTRTGASLSVHPDPAGLAATPQGLLWVSLAEGGNR